MGLLELRVVLCAVSVCQGIPTRQTMAAALVAVFLLSCQGGAQALCVSVFGPARPVSVASRQQQSCLSRKLPAIAGASSSPTSVSASDTSDSSSTERAAPAGFGSRAKRRKKGGSKQRKPGGDVPPVVVLKRSSRWACVKGCGACCYLAPDERPDLAEYLPDPKEFELYLSMSADDGWCKHFDKEERACTIYEDRPRFCRVETETFGDMYGVDPEDMDDFCSGCCSEQIGDVYGGKSKEMRVFKAALAALERGDRPDPELKPFGVDFQGEEKQIRDWGIGETSVDDARKR